MIMEEIERILEDSDDDGRALNVLVDEFRVGRDVKELSRLLSSQNDEIVSIGAWMLSELHFDLYRDTILVEELFRLTEHHDSSVRFNALGAVFPALNLDNNESRALLERLKNDENEGVRRKAVAAARSLGS